jgi:hypothetical protein
MLVRQLIVDKNGYSTIFIFQSGGEFFRFFTWHFQSWPTIPLKGGRLGETAQASDEATGGH